MEPVSSHLDRIAALLAAPPPRQVPPELRRAAMRQAAPLVLLVIGGGVTAFAMIFVLAFFPWNLSRQWKLDAANTATRPGKIVEVERTGMSIGKRPVMRYTFEYKPPRAVGVVRGVCYTTGSRWNVDTAVTVRHHSEDPLIACVDGARLTQAGAGAAFVVLFPGIGLSLVAVGLTLRRRTLRLLTHGQVTEARVTALERTATQINKNHVFKIALKRIDRPHDAPLEVRKYDPKVVAFARARLESKQPVYVLFDPQHPKRALLPEVL